MGRNLDGGWNIEITSPVSRGAWVIRATAYFDCDNDALVYADGVKSDLIPGDELLEKETASGLWGTLTFGGSAENMLVTWYDMMNSDGNIDNENNESRKKVVQKLATKQKRNPGSVEK